MAELRMRVWSTAEADFERAFAALLAHEAGEEHQVAATVRGIIEDVRSRGDAAVLDYTRKFDRNPAANIAELAVPAARLDEALRRLPAEQRDALEYAAGRVRSYHERQRAESWTYTDADGTLLGQQVTPLDRVGLYVPGGRAAYPSSVLMNAIPAKVAGVGEVLMVVPAPEGALNDTVLAAAAIAGVDRVYAVGGAQAVAALAYGTQTIPRVDKIVGPGNIYVAQAKRQVYGQVDIDMIAGPSEVVIVADGGAPPEWTAMDMFSQAEHGEDSQSILISLGAEYAERVRDAIARLLPTLERRDIVHAALERRGALIAARDIDEAIALVNRIAPEHLQLALEQAAEVAPRVRHAGAIFLGYHTTEVVGDYCAGPNHVLPTAGTARFSSPLGVYDFQKRSSLIGCSPAGAKRLAKVASVLARAEGLTAHARAAEFRLDPD